jgi:DNA-binding response OmpR family regulator
MDQEKFTQPGLKVLLVEDDQEFADILKFRLSKEVNPRLEITCFPTLQQALGAVEERTWDLILLDLMLPDSSGIQTFTTMRSKASHTPIVIMSGLDDDHLAIDAVRKGAEDYLVKGEINSRLLLRILHQYLTKLEASTPSDFGSLVRETVALSLQDGDTSIDTVASRLGLSGVRISRPFR